MPTPASPTILKIQVLATLNGPRERMAFERQLKALGMGTKSILTQEELARVGLACAAEVAQGMASLAPAIRQLYDEQLPGVLAAHARRDPEALDELALIFNRTFAGRR
jgi:hypothetical protein